MLVTREPTRRGIPHEEGQWIDICKLSLSQMKAARKAATIDSASIAKAFGPEIVKALKDDDSGSKKLKKLNRALQYEENQFDTEVLLTAGIVAWSYDADWSEAPICDLLDERTGIWIKNEIIDLNRPPSEEEEKNS